MAREISNSDDIIDSRDVIARIEELQAEKDGSDNLDMDWGEIDAEMATLTAFMEEMKGRGGDEQWRGDWYPVTIIRDSYFEDYARELLEDCGDLPKDLPHYIEIDWQATARNIRMDYTSVEFDGVTYWVR